jgi:uncharacterized damage-inducible protein DinB
MSIQIKEYENLMETYGAGPEQLEAVLQGLSGSQLDLSRAEGKWTIRQIVHHIADAEDLWETVIKAALGNTGCTFDISWYIPDNKCAAPLDYANRPIDDAVELFKAVRRCIAEMVKHLPDARERSALITRTIDKDQAQSFTFTVEKMLSWQIQHLEIHLEQIRETRELHGI